MSDFQESLNAFARDIAATRDERNIEQALQETGAKLIARQRMEAVSLLQPTLDRNKLAWDGLRRVLPVDPALVRFDESQRELNLRGRAVLLDTNSQQQLPARVGVKAGLAETSENNTLLNKYFQVSHSAPFGREKRLRRVRQPLLSAELSSCALSLSADIAPDSPDGRDNTRQMNHDLTRVALPIALVSDEEFERQHGPQDDISAMVAADYLQDGADSWKARAARQTQETYAVTSWLQGVTWEENLRAV